MSRNEEPHPMVRDWFIPVFANTSIWALTVCTVVMIRVFYNPSLATKPLPESETILLRQLLDDRTLILPIAVAFIFIIFVWFVSLFRSKKRKGSKSIIYLKGQVIDEFRSFSLNAASLNFSIFLFVKSQYIFLFSMMFFLIWILFQHNWLRNNRKSDFYT